MYLAKKIDELAASDPAMADFAQLVRAQKSTIMTETAYRAVVDQWCAESGVA